jgi:hypothetical protein
MDWLLTNGTVIDVLSIGEEALDEERLLYVRRRVARLLGLGSEDGPFPYVTREVMEALMVPGPLAVQNGRSYRLTAKGLRLYYALLEAVREAKGEGAVRQLEELRRARSPLSEAQLEVCPKCGEPISYIERRKVGDRVYLYAVHYYGYERGPDGKPRPKLRRCYLGPEEALQEEAYA